MKRIAYIDLLRTIAIFLVVLCHATESVYSLNLDYISSISFCSKIFCFFTFTAGRLGVPIFLLITGYLLLDREYNTETVFIFYKKNWLPLYLCTLFWLAIYDIFLTFYHSCDELNLLVFIKDILFIHNVKMSHVWYIPMILGIYPLLPFVSKALHAFDKKTLRFPIIFYGFYTFGYLLLNIVNHIYCPQMPLSLQISVGFSGGYYGIYLIFGCLIKQGSFKRVQKSVPLWIFIISFVSGVFLQIWSYTHGYAYNIWYDCPFLLFASVAFFEMVTRIKDILCIDLWLKLSQSAFGIFLTHNIVCYIVVDNRVCLKTIPPLGVCVLWVIVVLISYWAVWIIAQIPQIGKILLNMK